MGLFSSGKSVFEDDVLEGSLNWLGASSKPLATASISTLESWKFPTDISVKLSDEFVGNISSKQSKLTGGNASREEAVNTRPSYTPRAGFIGLKQLLLPCPGAGV
jgi:hypothetical protein